VVVVVGRRKLGSEGEGYGWWGEDERSCRSRWGDVVENEFLSEKKYKDSSRQASTDSSAPSS